MATGSGARLSQAPPQQSFSNLPAGYTTPNFTLPAGVAELQYTPVDINNPGTITLTLPTDEFGAALTASNSYTLTLSSGLGSWAGVTGCLWFQTQGGSTFTIATTAAVQGIVIYLQETNDVH
jgi:hypothetical protein